MIFFYTLQGYFWVCSRDGHLIEHLSGQGLINGGHLGGKGGQPPPNTLEDNGLLF